MTIDDKAFTGLDDVLVYFPSDLSGASCEVEGRSILRNVIC